MDARAAVLSVAVLFALMTLGVSGQNFYPLRYGRRDGLAGERLFLKSFRYDRRSDPPSGNELFYGTRYGKRSSNEARRGGNLQRNEIPAAPGVAVTESTKEAYHMGTLGDNPDTEISPTRNLFYVGSRFGKRSDALFQPDQGTNEKEQAQQDKPRKIDLNFLCQLMEFRHLHHCSEGLKQTGLRKTTF